MRNNNQFSRNNPINQIEIENEILRLLEELEEHTEAFEGLCIDFSKKESVYKGTWAQEYLGAKGSIKERESWADYKTDTLAYEYKIAEALVKTKREKLLSVRTAIDAMRTLNANVRVQV